MKNFLKFMRHIQLINWRIVVYSSKELMCLLKGDKLYPSFTPKKAFEFMENLEKGNEALSLPMGAYEYSCCVEYLKIIRKKVLAYENDLYFLVLVFNESNPYGIIVPPLEDCLEKVSEEIGFKLVKEEMHNDFYKYIYILESTL